MTFKERTPMLQKLPHRVPEVRRHPLDRLDDANHRCVARIDGPPLGRLILARWLLSVLAVCRALPHGSKWLTLHASTRASYAMRRRR